MSASRFRVVTVAREYGSGGAAIAKALAARLSYQLLDRALVERIAAEARIDPDLAERLDEHVDPWARRIGRALWYGGFEAVAVVDENDVVDSDRVAALGGRIVEEAAAAGACVIVGRGGQCLLRGRPDAFHVFVYAPRESRAAFDSGRATQELLAAVERGGPSATPVLSCFVEALGKHDEALLTELEALVRARRAERGSKTP